VLLPKFNQIVKLIEIIWNPTKWRPENLLNVDHFQKVSQKLGYYTFLAANLNMNPIDHYKEQ